MRYVIFCLLLFSPVLFSCSLRKQAGQQPTVNEIISAEGKPNILLAIADDMSWLHTSYAGCKAVKTPGIDYLARNGVWFNNAYCSAPSCSASRGALLTGRNGWELEEGACLWSLIPAKFRTYTEYLEEAGYVTGYTGKGWGPGDWQDSGRKKNPAGKAYQQIITPPYPELGEEIPMSATDYAANFEQFLREKPSDQPFCFFYGAFEPHRAYMRGIGQKLGKNTEDVVVPSFLPDVPEVRNDILDYLVEVEWFDKHLGNIIALLKEAGELDNTLIVVTSDNGMPFPRAKSNLYEYGTHMPLVVYWRNLIPGGRELDDMISLVDIAPTFLEAAGLPVPEEMAGKSLMNILNSNISGQADPQRNRVFTYRERHAWVHPGGSIYPMRSIRKDDYLLIWNQQPEMWPAGHPDIEFSHDFFPFGDVDGSPTKNFLLGLQDSENMRWYYDLSFGKRPELELYHLSEDPFQLKNLSGLSAYREITDSLKEELTGYLRERDDLRQSGKEDVYYNAPYYSNKGLASGGMRNKIWEALSEEEKNSTLERLQDVMQAKRQELRQLGWEMK